MRNEQLHFLELVSFDVSIPVDFTHHISLPTAIFVVLLEPAGPPCRLSPHHVACLERAAGMYSQLLHATHIRHQEGARQ